MRRPRSPCYAQQAHPNNPLASIMYTARLVGYDNVMTMSAHAVVGVNILWHESVMVGVNGRHITASTLIIGNGSVTRQLPLAAWCARGTCGFAIPAPAISMAPKMRG